MKNHNVYSYAKKLIWIYGVEQPDLLKNIKEVWVPCQCEFIKSFPESLMSRLEKSNDRRSLCIFDDVMNEVSSNATISKLFMLGRSHLGCSLVLIFQNIFPKGSQSRTISSTFSLSKRQFTNFDLSKTTLSIK